MHIRSIFEGYPLAKQKPRFCKQLIYEVNGLPSIELKYHYPDVADDDDLLLKLREQTRLPSAADQIVTVSQVNARHLQSLGVSADKIEVIPNGVDLSIFTPAATEVPPAYSLALDIKNAAYAAFFMSICFFPVRNCGF